MRPQFVDFNADGHLDIVTGTFDGYAHVAYGSKEGFGAPAHILDRNGNGIRHNMHYGKGWIYDDKTDQHQITSAFAFDWDNDKDLDLLLGDYRGGRIYLQVNDGTAKEPQFTGWNRPVETSDGKAIHFAGGISTIQMIDWDGDGKTDMLVGEMGSYSSTGAIHFFKNTGQSNRPSFAASEKLISGVKSGIESINGPERGLYFDATDYDGDGDLDLLVGGQAKFTPKMRELSAAEKQQAEDWNAKRTAATKARSDLYLKIYAEAEAVAPQATDPEGYAKARSAGFAKYREELATINQNVIDANAAYLALVPATTTKNQVWLYTNQTKKSDDTMGK